MAFWWPLFRHVWEGAQTARECLGTSSYSPLRRFPFVCPFSHEQMLFFLFAALQARPLKGQGLRWERGNGAGATSPTFSIYLSFCSNPVGFTAEHHQTPQQSPKEGRLALTAAPTSPNFSINLSFSCTKPALNHQQSPKDQRADPHQCSPAQPTWIPGHISHRGFPWNVRFVLLSL